MTQHQDPGGAGGGTPMDTRAAAHEQDAFWQRSFAERHYTDAQRGYDYYRPAYRLGWERARRGEADFDAVEDELREQWESERRELGWEEARPAVRDAWHRASNTDDSSPGNPLV